MRCGLGQAARVLATVALCGCTGGAHNGDAVRVFASASLGAAFTDLGDAFVAAHPGAKVDLHVAGTPRLVLQLREGAQAAVFASADERQMERARALRPGAAEPVIFARNRLAVAVAEGNPHGVRGLADLAREDLRVALCGPEVPAGRYAREALQRAGVSADSVSDEPSVQAVIAKLRLGELDAGVVYGTDVRDGNPEVDAVALPPAQVEVRCSIVALAPEQATASGFVAFVLSAEGRRILEEHGFLRP